MRPRAQRGDLRARRVLTLALLGVVLLVTLLLTAFGSGGAGRSAASAVLPAPAWRLLPAGRPHPEVVATQSALRLQLPIAQSRITAIGYHADENGALPLQPLGRQANAGILERLLRRIVGGGSGGLRYDELDGGLGTADAALDVGAATGTDVYAPVDGTVVGLTDYVVSGRRYGARIDIQPASAPSVVVSLTQIRPDPSLSVGSIVSAASSKVGTVVDLSGVQRQALARYTQDAGNHVSIEVHPAATLTLP